MSHMPLLSLLLLASLLPPLALASDSARTLQKSSPIEAPRGLRVTAVRPLSAMSRTRLVTAGEFTKDVIDSDRPVLLFCVSQNSRSARTMAPVIGDLALHYAERLRVLELDIDSSPDIADRYVISGVPAYMVFEQGRLVAAKRGTASRDELVSWLDDMIR